MPHRILMLSHHSRAALGGALLADRALAEALREQGHEVDLLFYEDLLPPAVRATWRQLVFPWAAALAFLRRRRGRRWDVIESTAGDAWIIARLLRLLRTPRPLLSVRTHGLEHRRAAIERARLAAAGRHPTFASRLYHFHWRLWEVASDLRSADAVFLLNREDARHAVKALGLPPEKIHVVANGLPAHLLSTEEPAADPERAFRLLFLGAWTPAKGADLLPAIVRRIFPTDPRWRLTCAGVQVPAETVRTGFAAADRSRVEAIPRYEPCELPGILRRHGIFLFPSPAEGCSLALLEAMAGGLVPVTTRTGYAADLLAGGGNGVLVERGDTAGFADAVLSLAGDAESLPRLGAAARASVADHSWPSRAAERTRIWDRVPSP